MGIPAIYLLAVSLLTLAAGPLLYKTAQAARSPLLAALDGFVFVAIGGLILLHVLPESVALGGWAAALACLVGLMAPTLLEHRLHDRARQVHAVALLLGLAALGLHAFMDGLVLGGGHEGESHAHHMLPMAVILHRLPEGLMVWFLVRPLYGLPKALATLGLIGVSTVVGFSLSELVASSIEHQGRGLFQALVGGSLLHVIMHRSYPISSGAAGRPGRLQAGLGALGGLVLLWLITHDAEAGLAQAGEVFYALALESGPALLLAYVSAGLIYAFLPRASVAWMSKGPPLSQALRGMAFGLPLPICSCGVVPVYRSLVLQGIPIPAAMAFLISTPELSLDALLLSLPLLGGPFTLARLACAAFVALAIGWGLGRLIPPVAAAATPPPILDLGAAASGGWARLRAGLATGLGEVVESTAPWILLGLGVAAIAEPLIQDSWFQALPSVLEVGFFALLGIPTYVCASGATPLAAVLIHKGVSPGAALAFLLTGPATNITTFLLLSRLHGRGAALAFGGLMALLAVVLGHLVNLMLPSVDAFPTPHAEAGLWPWVQQVCLAAVAALFLLALLRQGPRAFVGELFAEADEEDPHEHEHHTAPTCTEESCCR